MTNFACHTAADDRRAQHDHGTTHCPHCYDHHQSPYTGECPGLVCNTCADMQATLDAWKRGHACEACEAKDKEIAALKMSLDAAEQHVRILNMQREEHGVKFLALQAATRKVVEAAARWKSAKDSAVRGFSEREPGIMTDFMGAAKALIEQSIAMDDLQAALADPVLVALRRE